MLVKIVAASLITVFLVGSLLVMPALAGGNGKGNTNTKFGYGYRPGWGWGDDNHIHTGPPGQCTDPDNGEGYCYQWRVDK